MTPNETHRTPRSRPASCANRDGALPLEPRNDPGANAGVKCDNGVTNGPWRCAGKSFDWDRGRDIAACKVLCARCTTRRECAALWLAGTPGERRYGIGVWAGFDMSDRTDRAAFHRWVGRP